MNILVIGKFSPDQFGFHIADTLKDMGHKVIQFDPSLEYKYSKTIIGRRIYQTKFFIYNAALNAGLLTSHRIKKLTKILRTKKIDLIICTYDFLFPDEIERIKQITNAAVTLWFPDAISNFNKAFFLISEYDYLFFKDPYIVQILTENYNKKNVFYLPECCDPKYHKSIILNETDIKKYGCDITTFGSPHNFRTLFFIQLLEFNYEIKIWGNQPPVWLRDNKIKSLYTGEYVFYENKAKAVLAAKININTLHPSEILGLNSRTFQIAGIGGFQLIHWRPTLSNFFEDGKELVSFRNFDELLEKIEYYLPREELRKEIGTAGQFRAYKDHTYQKRLKTLIDVVFNHGQAFDIPDLTKK